MQMSAERSAELQLTVVC